MENIAELALKQKYLLGLRTAAGFYSFISITFFVQNLFFPLSSDESFVRFILIFHFIAAIIQLSVAYFATLKNYNWFTAILVVEVTVHILVMGGAGNAELIADPSVSIDAISGRMVDSSFWALGHFLAVCILFFRLSLFLYFSALLTVLLVLGLIPLLTNEGVYFTIERGQIFYDNNAINRTQFIANAYNYICVFGMGLLILWQVNRHAKTSASLERSNTALGRYFSPEIKSEIEESEDGLANQSPKDLEIAVMFTDLVGFTKLSENMEPKAVLKLLSTYQTLMVETIFQHSGTVDKFIGDAVMANFGTPRSHGNDAQNAFECALVMNKKLAAWNVEREASGLKRISHRIGIHFGPCVAGNMGSEQRVEFAVIGDAVNVASRICDACKEFDTNFLISDELAKRITHSEKSETVHGYKIRGRNEPINLIKIY